jgi:hypothetical protein
MLPRLNEDRRAGFSAAISKLLEVREEPSFGWIEAATLGVFAAVVLWMSVLHQPWVDEAQAWLIARDCTLREIFLIRLHYEGTPGLWHLLLWVLARLHVSYGAMRLLPALLGIATAWMILKYSPFCLPLRVALPFMFSFLYLTSLVARSYSLVPPLVCLLCILLSRRRDRPIAFACAAGLLANAALAAGLISVGFAIVYIWIRGLRSKDDGAPSWNALSRLQFGSILVLFWGAALYTAFPAPDVSYPSAQALVENHAATRILSSVTGIAPPLPGDWDATADAERIQRAFAPMEAHRREMSRRPAMIRALGALLLIFSILFFSISASSLLAACFLAALVAWSARCRSLPALLPLLLVALGASILPMNEHHLALLTSPLIAALWLIWNRSRAGNAPIRLGRTGPAFAILLILVVGEQCGWTVSALHLSTITPFDGSRDAAQFIRTAVQPRPIAGFGYYSTAAQPFFGHSVFFNQQTAYWPWKLGSDPDFQLTRIIAERPQFVLTGEGFLGDAVFNNQILKGTIPVGWPHGLDAGTSAYLAAHGYRPTRRFCGRQPAHFGYSEETCLMLYEPVSPSPR